MRDRIEITPTCYVETVIYKRYGIVEIDFLTALSSLKLKIQNTVP